MSAVLSLAIQPNIYYTVEEASQLLRVSAEEVQGLLQSGQMPGIKIGQHWRVLGAALLDLSPGLETEASHVHDWLGASMSSLMEVWDNEEDAVYDNL